MDENDKNGVSTPQPTIEATDIEKEQHAIDSLVESVIEQQDIRVRIELPAAMGLLREYGLTVDENGFVIDNTTNDVVEPAMYDAEKFAAAPQPNEYDVTAYFTKSSSVIKGEKEKLHLSDVYTVIDVSGTPRPVSDSGINIEKMHRDTGLVFATTTAWSNDVNLEKLKESIETVTIDTQMEPVPELNCLKCGFQAGICDWHGKTNSPVCPDCKTDWNVELLHECKECSNAFSDSELMGDDVFATPTCPSCNETSNMQSRFTSRRRYD